MIEYAKARQDEDEDIMLDWINSKTTKERFTALHFASFKGCLKSVYILINSGADINQTNSFGLTMLHVAAQGDSANTLYYFTKIKKLDLNSKDSRGSTPLHWACHS